MNLYLTVNGRYVGTQAEARAQAKGWTPEEVPTDKAGLIAYLNRLMSAVATVSAPFSQALYCDQAEPIQPMLTRAAMQPLTQARVDEMFANPEAKPPLPRDAVCESIASYHGADLGYVALEVAARFTALGKETVK